MKMLELLHDRLFIAINLGTCNKISLFKKRYAPNRRIHFRKMTGRDIPLHAKIVVKEYRGKGAQNAD